MLKKILVTVAILAATGQSILAEDDYYNFGEWSLSKTALFGIGGFIDNNGKIPGGQNGDEYIIFKANDSTGKHGYIYRVTVNGDPNAHPDAPNGLPIADRNFTFVSETNDTDIGGGGSQEFYVDDTGIYYGNAAKIVKWDHNWTNKTTELTASGLYTETLARNAATGDWWTATGSRAVYRYNTTTNTWDYQFNYPTLGGGHHDGMEIVNNKLYLSDMTSDKIIVYDLNSNGDVVPDSNVTYSYTANPDVEGMGYGPNQHFWFSGGQTVYEVGGGKLVPSCSQTFTYNACSWVMSRSKCDDITVPGLTNAVMAKFVVSDQTVHLEFATANTVAKNWLENKGFIVQPEFTLHTGEGFWTFSEAETNQTVSNGKLRNHFMEFEKDIVSFVGFGLSTDLNNIFAGKPVEEIRYYDNEWHIWRPGDGEMVVAATQGLYVYPSDDFSILLK